MIVLENLTEMLKGVLEGCVLEIISRKETYGYEITRRLNALGFTDVVDGTVYTILVRLEKNKLVEISKKASDVGPPEKIKFNIWPHTDFTGRNLMPIFDGVLELLEEGAADGQSVREILGDDIKDFCSSLAGEEGTKSMRDRWREQLKHTVAKKLGK